MQMTAGEGTPSHRARKRRQSRARDLSLRELVVVSLLVTRASLGGFSTVTRGAESLRLLSDVSDALPFRPMGFPVCFTAPLDAEEEEEVKFSTFSLFTRAFVSFTNGEVGSASLAAANSATAIKSYTSESKQ
jgi:hypothetical protein